MKKIMISLNVRQCLKVCKFGDKYIYLTKSPTMSQCGDAEIYVYCRKENLPTFFFDNVTKDFMLINAGHCILTPQRRFVRLNGNVIFKFKPTKIVEEENRSLIRFDKIEFFEKPMELKDFYNPNLWATEDMIFSMDDEAKKAFRVVYAPSPWKYVYLIEEGRK